MAYYLTVKKAKDNYQKIDISLLDCFVRTSKFQNAACSLQEIDEFTSLFENERGLKTFLYENGLIEVLDLNKELSVRMASKSKLVKVMYGLVYKDMKKYLDYNYLRSVFLVLQSDRNFLEKFVSFYKNSYSSRVQIIEITNYISNNCNFRVDIYNSMNEFFVREVFDVDDKTGDAKIKYKSLHILAMFVYNYISLKEQKSSALIDNLTNSNSGKVVSNSSNVKTKKLTKSEINKLPIDGQISLFD